MCLVTLDRSDIFQDYRGTGNLEQKIGNPYQICKLGVANSNIDVPGDYYGQ